MAKSLILNSQFSILNLNCTLGADNPSVAQEYAQRAFEEFFAHIEALLNLLWRTIVGKSQCSACRYNSIIQHLCRVLNLRKALLL